VTEREFKHVFGPVPSRRLGRSLGVDLVPYKTCSYDCLYCQIGRTTAHTLERSEHVPLEDVLAEVRRKLSAGARPDYVTVSGSGEPTLYSRLGELIAGLKQLGVPVAVLTNGSLLWREDVASAVAAADLVCPSLDAGTAEVWAQVNRPPEGLDFEKMLEGLVAFRGRFAGQIWLEVLLLAGFSDSDAEVEAIAAHAARIRPQKIQLNTVVRPPAEAEARPVSRQALERYAGFFDPRAEVIADFGADAGTGKETATENALPSRTDDVLEMLGRRPCTSADVAAGLELHINEVVKLVEKLLARGKINATESDGHTYYELARGD
jgi:wyosine [tRNA(Phe)-imidazoG37] synthetase (radical SAM superfamily)